MGVRLIFQIYFKSQNTRLQGYIYKSTRMNEKISFNFLLFLLTNKNVMYTIYSTYYKYKSTTSMFCGTYHTIVQVGHIQIH